MSHHGLSDFPVRRVWSFQEHVQNLPSELSPSLLLLYGTVCQSTSLTQTLYCRSKNILKLIYTNAPTSRNPPAKRLWICVNIWRYINLDLIWFSVLCNDIGSCMWWALAANTVSETHSFIPVVTSRTTVTDMHRMLHWMKKAWLKLTWWCQLFPWPRTEYI